MDKKLLLLFASSIGPACTSCEYKHTLLMFPYNENEVYSWMKLLS